MNSEVGPVVVPKEWDFAAARIRKWKIWYPRIKRSERGGN
jgi:hypothetical protein